MKRVGKSRIRYAAGVTGATVVVSLLLSSGGPPGGDQGASDTTRTPSTTGSGHVPTAGKGDATTAGKGDASQSPALTGRRTIRVQANLQVGEELDLGAQGRSVGDQFVFSGTLRSRQDDRQVGRVGGFCVVNDLQRNAGECSLTAVLDGAQLAIQGEQAGIPTPERATNAITGGTGRFRNAHGQMTLRALTPSTWNLTFHVAGR